MKSSTTTFVLVLIVLAIGGWYWWGRASGESTEYHTGQMGTNGSENRGNMGGSAASTSPESPGAMGDGSDISQNLTLGVDSNATLGKYLIAYNGMTLYRFAKDTDGTSHCTTGVCAQTWAPYSVPAGMHLNLEAGVTGAASTIVRPDGVTQVTYKGMPLYFFAGDTKPGDANGEGYLNGAWHVVAP